MIRLVRAGATLLAVGALAAPVCAHASSTGGRVQHAAAPATFDGIYVKTAIADRGLYVKTAIADRGLYVKTDIPADGLYVKTV